MLKIFKFNQNNSLRKLEKFLDKRKSIQKGKSSIVKKIINNVKKSGDKAVLNYEKKFSKVKKKNKKIYFSNKELNKISKKTDKKIKQAINLAFNRIKRFHSKQKFSSFKLKDKYKNQLSYKYSALDKVKGIGPITKKKLLKKFKSLKKIKEASNEELMTLKNINETMAKEIKQRL